jgi:Tfp pilus assembly protein PilZ
MAELAAEFVPLDRRRRDGDPPLGAGEQERWAELRDQLAYEFGDALPVGPIRPARHLRVPARLDARIGPQGEVVALENLSEGGVFVCCKRPLAPGTRFRLEIQSPLLDEPLDVDAMVVHCREFANRDGPAGFGALFPDPGRDQRRALADLVEAELASAVGSR